ncbi:hypothetical protein DVV91_02645 [Clostridium botulinum]|uniref:hypothetical protein n=1 Tax=Clostridium botulinum TaxID=1491 RepID=UPI001967B96D|nr:hypothetical protein [Clostridium botulinum]MBN1073242.1 hypothetical protein [Clostridium botulinum]
MYKFVGIRWGALLDETRKFLLERASCNQIEKGECIVDLTNDLSIAGKIVDGTIIIYNDAIIYHPSER